MSPCLFLIRHAQSANNALEERHRIPDPPITELGHLQAKRLAEAVGPLRLTRVYVSPFLRSIQTAIPIVQAWDLPALIHRDIFEQGGCYRGYAIGDRFPMPGMGRSQLAALCPGWEIDPRIGEEGWNELPTYEELAQARRRARIFVQWLRSQTLTADDRWGLVIHADFKLRLLEALLGRDDIEHHLGDVINTSITKLSLDQSGWKLDFWNAHQHLAPEHISC